MNNAVVIVSRIGSPPGRPANKGKNNNDSKRRGQTWRRKSGGDDGGDCLGRAPLCESHACAGHLGGRRLRCSRTRWRSAELGCWPWWNRLPCRHHPHAHRRPTYDPHTTLPLSLDIRAHAPEHFLQLMSRTPNAVTFSPTTPAKPPNPSAQKNKERDAWARPLGFPYHGTTPKPCQPDSPCLTLRPSLLSLTHSRTHAHTLTHKTTPSLLAVARTRPGPRT